MTFSLGAPKDLASKNEQTRLSDVVRNARQLEQDGSIRILDQSFQDLFVSGGGRPVWCQKSSLLRFPAL